MHEREQKAAEEKKLKAEAPTVRSELEQRKYEEQKAQDEKPDAEKSEKEKEAKREREKEKEKKKIKIRPLTDARAIELGANFFSETFIFAVAVGLLLTENWRNSRKTSARRDEVEERLDALEAQIERLQQEHKLPELEALNENIKKARADRNKSSWYNPAGWWRRTDPDLPDDDDEGIPGEVESPGERRISGSVPGPPPARAVKVASKDSTTKAAEDSKVKVPPAAAASPARVESVEATKKER
jgi:actin-related protein